MIGLSVLVPLGITLSIVWWLGATVEHVIGRWLQLLVPEGAYWRGTGMLVGLVLTWVLGVFMRFPSVQLLFVTLEEQIIERIPVVRSIYGSVRDFMRYVVVQAGGKKRKFNHVVAVTLGGTQARLLGLVTRENLGGFLQGVEDLQDAVMVYFPMSYQLGGYTTIVPKSAIERVDMSVEDAIRLTMTAGVSVEKPPADNRRRQQGATAKRAGEPRTRLAMNILSSISHGNVISRLLTWCEAEPRPPAGVGNRSANLNRRNGV
jgi:uncharacterized membrane protein